jgi:hypothetical protein
MELALKLGDIVGDYETHKVITCTQISERVEGRTYASWLAICLSEYMEISPYVVWEVVAKNGEFMCVGGHYSSTLADAMNNYNERNGKPADENRGPSFLETLQAMKENYYSMAMWNIDNIRAFLANDTFGFTAKNLQAIIHEASQAVGYLAQSEKLRDVANQLEARES